MRTQKQMIDRLAVTLALALDEIHHPGASAAGGFDITAMCEAVIKEATKLEGVPQMIRDEAKRRTVTASSI